jgi:hypothetical protein
VVQVGYYSLELVPNSSWLRQNNLSRVVFKLREIVDTWSRRMEIHSSAIKQHADTVPHGPSTDTNKGSCRINERSRSGTDREWTWVRSSLRHDIHLRYPDSEYSAGCRERVGKPHSF